jgi:hypothetical protein
MLVLRRSLPLLTLILLAAGCSGSKATNSASISGKLSYKGDPIKAGVMQFHTQEQGVYAATINPDGTYTATQLPIGTVVVTVETESINPNRKQTNYGRGKNQMKMSKAETTPPTLEYLQIPPKYAQATTSGITIELKPGKNKQNLDLTD